MVAAPPSDVDLVFLDLGDAVAALELARHSPRDVRRALSRYVELSQRLTSAMRKDYSRRGRGVWQAISFPAWNSKTELLKYLRNQDQHGEQVFITVHDRHYYRVPEGTEIAGIPGREFIVDARWQLTDQTLDRPPEGLEVKLFDTGTPPGAGDILLPGRTDSSFVLYPRTPEDEQRVARAGVTDLYQFVHETFATLRAYYEFYQSAVGA